ncbi:class I SAM-dependent methyltransferase [Cyclobacterium xiamenense]|uniref:class I SAM-dependent methyltransferase n=1 Tax=Cyclobacterium xiamenense TaxID=1297121 RepID=UPI0035CFC3EA
MKSESSKHWKEWGKNDPYYGVLSEEKFRMKHLSERVLEEFFDTGAAFAEQSRNRIQKKFGLDIADGSILDFGCGVGRLAIPFARMTGKEVWGLDISEDIIARAKAHARALAMDHLRFATYNGDSLEGIPEFDFVNSYIVFQHIEPRQGMHLLRELLDHTRTGGIFQVQVTYGHCLPKSVYAHFYLRTHFPLYNFLYSSLKHRRFCREPVMQMNHYAPEKLFALFAGYSDEVQVEFTNHGGHLGAFYLLRKNQSP